nr:GDSL esterase/lipase 1-like [Ipomoea batatas]
MASLYSYVYALALLGNLLATPVLCLAHQKKHVALFAFGDSLFDPGNNNYINTTTLLQANFWPYGESFFKDPTGRFSDGRIVPDFIAEFAKLPLIPGYFQAEQGGFINGVIDLKKQVQYFKNVAKQLKGKLGEKDSNKLLSSAVYMICIGSNDYIGPFITNSTILNTYSHEEYVNMVIGNITNAIKEIHMEGGRKFVIYSVAPLGCIPFSRALKLQQTNRTGCFKELHVLTEMHNKALPRKLINLEKTLQGFKCSYFDFFTVVNNAIDHPSRYGLKEAKTACCGSGPYRGLPSCGGERRQFKEYELCKDVGDYLFFDFVHPTEKFNQLTATLLWNGDPNIVRPYSVKSFFEHV